MKKMRVGLCSVLACLFVISQTVLASEKLTTFHKELDDTTISVYVENPGDYEEVTCQIGQDYLDDVSVKKLTDSEISIDTYILIDNSLSIQEKYRNTMKQVAKDIVLAGKDNEKFTIATFDTELHYLAENSDESEALIKCIDQIVFQDLETKVFDILYRLYMKMETDDEDSFKRIIFMSDGMETKTIGYTREELMDKARENGYPVYILGCSYKSNETELENMYRISRETNAGYYHLDNAESAEQIAAGIEDSFDMVQVQVTIPESQQDGSSKGIKIVFKSAEEEKIVTFSQDMPFYSVSETEENVTETKDVNAGEGDAAEPEPEDETVAGEDAAEPEDETVADEDVQKYPVGFGMLILGGVCAATLFIVVVVVIISRKKNSKNKVGSSDVDEDSQTEFLGDDSTELLDDDDATAMTEMINIRLIDTKRPSKIMEYSLESSLILGRNPEKCQVVFDYEKSISSQHCEIYRAGGKIYIRDLHSSNGTYVDGQLVEEAVELSGGSMIKIGRLQIEFQVI